MSKQRSISTSFWSDPFIEELEVEEKLLYIYLISNEKTNMLGIYELSDKKISFETGISIEKVKQGFEMFQQKNKIKRIKNYLILTNFLKHQNFNTNMKKSAIATHNNLPEVLKVDGRDIDFKDVNEGFKHLSKGLGLEKKQSTKQVESVKETTLIPLSSFDIPSIDNKEEILQKWVDYKSESGEAIKTQMQIEALYKDMHAMNFEDLTKTVEFSIKVGAKNIIWNHIQESKSKENASANNNYDKQLSDF